MAVGHHSPFWGKFRRIRDSDLSIREKYLLTVLADHGGQDGDAFPKQKTLAKELSLEQRQVRNLIRGLESQGVIKTKRRSQGKGNAYEIQWNKLSSPAIECRSNGESPTPSPAIECRSNGESPTPSPAIECRSYRQQSAALINRERNIEIKKPETGPVSAFGKGGKSSRAFNRWCSKIKPADFPSLDRGLEHFENAVKAGLYRPHEDLSKFLTLWLHCGHGAANGTIDNPAGTFVRNLQNNNWYGRDAWEDTVRDFLLARKGRKPSQDYHEETHADDQTHSIADVLSDAEILSEIRR